MPLCAVAMRRRGCPTSLATRLREQYWDITTEVFWKRRIGEAERCTSFHRRHLRGDNRSPHTSNARLCRHRDLMKLLGRVKVAQPGTVTDGRRR
jgi:hypothetical protein